MATVALMLDWLRRVRRDPDPPNPRAYVLKIDKRDVDILARTVWGEARGESYMGKCAVAWVVKNRTGSGKWFDAGTIADTAMKPWQFSCWNGDRQRETMWAVTLDDPVFQECYLAALQVLRPANTPGSAPDQTQGATHYHNANVKPKWADPSKATVAIGGHIFYKDID